jgi:hypothetical protein
MRALSPTLLSISIVVSCCLVSPSPVDAQQQAVRVSALWSLERDSVDQSQQAQRQRRRRRRSAGSSNVGYVDNAIVGNQLQIRYDFASGVTRADRAEFIYAKCGCYREVGVDPDAPGPAVPLAGRDPFTTPFIETDLDMHDVVLDFEYAFHERFSVFAEVPFRILKPAIIPNGSGIGDVRAGFKVALVAGDARYFTFQWGTYIPTGDALKGLGTDHVSLEPALFYHDALSDRAKLEWEFRLWFPVGGATALGTGAEFDPTDDFAGPVLRYGIGIGYDVTPESAVRFTPVLELVGWTVTNGIETGSTDGTLSTAAIEEAGGTTIINAKIGARFGLRENDSIFVGFGEALTDNWWYERIVRAEYRLVF